jgi:hypothetical protein
MNRKMIEKNRGVIEAEWHSRLFCRIERFLPGICPEVMPAKISHLRLDLINPGKDERSLVLASVPNQHETRTLTRCESRTGNYKSV